MPHIYRFVPADGSPDILLESDDAWDEWEFGGAYQAAFDRVVARYAEDGIDVLATTFPVFSSAISEMVLEGKFRRLKVDETFSERRK